jgi:hypothetical protein
MAATALLTNKTTNGAGTGVSVTGPCTVFFDGDSVFGGARVEIQVAITDTDAEYSYVGKGAVAYRPEPKNITPIGAYYVRAKVFDAGSTTNISASVNQ